MTTTVVMVHGIRTSATMWRAQREHLAARGVPAGGEAGFLIVVDLRDALPHGVLKHQIGGVEDVGLGAEVLTEGDQTLR